MTNEQLPYLSPEVVLLYKAARARERDELDLATDAAAPPPAQRDWMAHAIAVVHPGHDWIGRVGGQT